jgi:hypothetical protein
MNLISALDKSISGQARAGTVGILKQPLLLMTVIKCTRPAQAVFYGPFPVFDFQSPLHN